ncbi:sulfite exporter TauE/SafE family protein [Salsipaludibacter albus]|uniref:sulfite exporter TauE/SafE family protein n=1 Tax=Salsipaludibacter albus TaxID=2849650 RepID=UPI001EE3DFD2|nr:sulfite exporter TauE/SafE family protein [Salsipaludibacter albus]MBY5163103.1 sulfite exporter TauE/SafE family protein [Salsipaludibacter albus]
MTLALTLALSVLIGISLGLLGGGGSILTVPILVWVAGQDPKAAIATSLLVVGVTAAAGAVSHARAGRVQWRTGLVFGGGGMVGAYAGGRLAAFVPGDWLLVAFGIMMAVTAVAMLRGPDTVPSAGDGRLATGHAILHGLAVGVVTGLVGAGGGFLVVPALVLLGGLPMATAVGTSLVVIAMKSAAGLAGYLATVQLDWGLALGVTAAAIVGTVIGNRLVSRIPQDSLRRGFGWFVVAMAVIVLGQQLAGDVPIPGGAATLVGAGVLATAVAAIVDLRRMAARGSERTSPTTEQEPEQVRP